MMLMQCRKGQEEELFFCAIYIKVRDVKIKERGGEKTLHSATLTLFHGPGCSSAKQDSHCKEDYKPIHATELEHATGFSGTV